MTFNEFEELKNNPCESFYMRNIKKGLELQGDTLTDFDYKILTLSIIKELDKLDEIFEKNGVNKIEWNDRLVKALKVAFDDDVEDIGSELNKALKMRPPHELWESMLLGMHGKSEMLISGIAQNWYHTHWTQQARKSATKTLRTGCLIPVILFLFTLFFIGALTLAL